MEENKKKLVILTANDSEHIIFTQFFKPYFNIEFITKKDLGERIPDLIIFTGGEDVTPEYYKEKVGKYTSFNPNRDKIENVIFQKYHHIPKLGICRGAQILTVFNGGKLIQHVEGHSGSHEVETIFNKEIEVTSTHHQMMYPFNMNELNYELIGWSKYYKSKVYLNGNDEQINKPKDFLEPEIVYYEGGNSLCIHGHPEYNHATKEFKDFTINLIKKYLFKEKIELQEKIKFIPDFLQNGNIFKINKQDIKPIPAYKNVLENHFNIEIDKVNSKELDELL
jgi:hypothetical protein